MTKTCMVTTTLSDQQMSKLCELSANARRLFKVFKTYDGQPFPSIEELQQKMGGLHRLPLKSCFRRLTDNGFIAASEQV